MSKHAYFLYARPTDSHRYQESVEEGEGFEEDRDEYTAFEEGTLEDQKGFCAVVDLMWYVDDDNEHVKIATTDNYRFDPTFDFERTVKTTKWKTAITEDFINRMCESLEDAPYDLPIPEE